jgi:hypothetical protein
MADATNPERASDSLEREKWEAERGFRERELVLREREQEHKKGELARAAQASAGARWSSPVVVAILAAAVAAAGNALVAYTTSVSAKNLEAQKAEQARILEVVRTGNPDKAAVNLRFLLRAGLIDDGRTRARLTAFLDQRKPGTGPSLPQEGIFRTQGRFSSGAVRG